MFPNIYIIVREKITNQDHRKMRKKKEMQETEGVQSEKYEILKVE